MVVQKKEIEIEEKEVAQEIQVVHKGDTVCEECGVDYKSTTALNGHVIVIFEDYGLQI